MDGEQDSVGTESKEVDNLFRINFISRRVASCDKHDSHIYAQRKRPRIKTSPPHFRRLAIVGGGPSVKEHLEELANWDGDIWAINWTCHWLSDNGIASKLYAVDSSIDEIKRPALCKGAILASCMHPSIFDEFQDAECFDLYEDAPGGVVGGSSTATRAFMLSMQMGYFDVHFFGCEGSFPEGQTHVDRNETQFPNTLHIKAGDNVYLTRDDLYHQTECMADVIRAYPGVFTNRSGGLLQGMIEHPFTWGVVSVSKELEQRLKA